MRLYRVEREGFRLIRINQAEKDAQAEDGTELKISLSDLGPPQVEIKDDFVRITVRRPTESPPAETKKTTKTTKATKTTKTTKTGASPPDAGGND
jgi:hypothetical protein